MWGTRLSLWAKGGWGGDGLEGRHGLDGRDGLEGRHGLEGLDGLDGLEGGGFLVVRLRIWLAEGGGLLVALLCLAEFALFFFAEEFFEELGGGAGLFGVADFGRGGEGAVDGVEGDFGDGVFGGGVLVVLLDLLEVEAGDLEAVEEQAGAARVEAVGGDALQDLADGVLDGAAVFGQGEEEGWSGPGRLGWLGSARRRRFRAGGRRGRRRRGWCGGNSRNFLRGGRGSRSGGRR